MISLQAPVLTIFVGQKDRESREKLFVAVYGVGDDGGQSTLLRKEGRNRSKVIGACDVVMSQV